MLSVTRLPFLIHNEVEIYCLKGFQEYHLSGLQSLVGRHMSMLLAPVLSIHSVLETRYGSVIEALCAWDVKSSPLQSGQVKLLEDFWTDAFRPR